MQALLDDFVFLLEDEARTRQLNIAEFPIYRPFNVFGALTREEMICAFSPSMGTPSYRWQDFRNQPNPVSFQDVASVVQRQLPASNQAWWLRFPIDLLDESPSERSSRLRRAAKDKAEEFLREKERAKGKQIQPYVFISHSSKDATIISAVKNAFEDLPVKPHFVEEKPTGVPPSREIAQAVKDAEALFVFFTYNSILSDTRDWIVFEMGVAVGHGRPIYSWKQRNLVKEQLPRLLEQVSTHRDFELSGDGTIKLAAEVRDAARGLKQP